MLQNELREMTRMAATLTFYPRRALIEATGSGQSFSVPTYRDPARVAAWAKTQEFRPGKVTLWDHAFELPGGQPGDGANVIRRIAVGPRTMETYDFPGVYAQRFDGAGKAGGDACHAHTGTSLYVGTRSSGIHVHGWPPCNRKTCIIVLRQWDDLLRAIAGEKHLSFSIAN
jgi:hypothetical protein